MSLTPSLRNRVRRLEQQAGPEPVDHAAEFAAIRARYANESHRIVIGVATGLDGRRVHFIASLPPRRPASTVSPTSTTQGAIS